jgi:hypothetical protein
MNSGNKTCTTKNASIELLIALGAHVLIPRDRVFHIVLGNVGLELV